MITLINAIALCLVVCRHLPTLPSGGVLEYSVPWFFFVSGLCYGRTKRIFKYELKKRLTSLLLPYFLWNAIWSPVLIAANWAGWRFCGLERSVDASLLSILRCLGFSIWQWPALVPTWFLRALFVTISIVGGLWSVIPRFCLRSKHGERVYRVFLAFILISMVVTRRLWCPNGEFWDGFFAFGVPIHGMACFAVGGAVAMWLGESVKVETSPMERTIRRQLMPVYLIHAIVIVFCGWFARAIGYGDVLKTFVGDVAMWLVCIFGAIAIGELMRRKAPRAASILFGGR